MIGIVIVNWNGWSDTLESLESILRQRGLQCRIVVCDNASSDEAATLEHRAAVILLIE